MKRLIILFFLLSTITSYSQQFEHNYLKDNYKLYKGCLFKIRDDFKMREGVFQNEKLLEKKYYDTKSLETNLPNLKGRIFKVDTIFLIANYPYDPTPIFLLVDTATKEKIYFKYRVTKYDETYNFPFLTSKIPYDKYDFSESITKDIDEFTGLISFNTPYQNSIDGDWNDLAASKEGKKGKYSYFLTLTLTVDELDVERRDVRVLFSDNTQWTKNLKIKIKPDRDADYRYYADILLSPNDINSLLKKRIKKFRIAGFDRDIGIYESDFFRVLLKYLVQAK